MYYLAQNQDVQERVVAEIQTVRGDNDDFSMKAFDELVYVLSRLGGNLQ